MLRVLMLWKGVLGRWGVSDVIENVGVRLPRYGIMPIVACDHAGTEDFGARTGIRCVRQRMLPGLNKPFEHFRVGRELAGLALSERIDVCHAHAVSSPARSALFLKKKLGIPFAITSHGELTPAYRERERWSGSRLRRAKLHLANADAVTSLNSAMLGYANQLTDVTAKNVVIPNGCDFSWWRSRQEFKTARRPYFVAVGRLAGLKGLDALVRAERFLLDSGIDISIAFAGEGDEEGAIRELSTSLGLKVYDSIDGLMPGAAPGICFCGFVEGSLKRELISGALALVHPNRTSEAFGIVLVEAFAAGRPVVCYCLPTFTDIVEDGITGRMISPPGDESAFVKALAEFATNPELADRMSEDCLVKASNFDWDGIALRYAELYKRLAAKN